jgi:uncharacterized membrane protein
VTVEIAIALASIAGPGLIALGMLWSQNRQNARDIRDARDDIKQDYNALLQRIHGSNDKIQQLLLDVSYLLRIRDGGE